MDILPSLFQRDTETELKWLVDQTEKWCQDRALFGAVMESISIIDGKHKSLTKGALPDILSKALAVTFDTNIGHDYLADAEERYKFYHETEDRDSPSTSSTSTRSRRVVCPTSHSTSSLLALVWVSHCSCATVQQVHCRKGRTSSTSL